jgi:hypothetical protein
MVFSSTFEYENFHKLHSIIKFNKSCSFVGEPSMDYSTVHQTTTFLFPQKARASN